MNIENSEKRYRKKRPLPHTSDISVCCAISGQKTDESDMAPMKNPKKALRFPSGTKSAIYAKLATICGDIMRKKSAP